MFKEEELLWAVGENLNQIRYLLEFTAKLLYLSKAISSEDKQTIGDEITKIIAVIDNGIYGKIIDHEPKIRDVYCIPTQDVKPKPRPRSPNLKERLQNLPIPADSLEFSDRITSILIRQTIFSVRLLLDRGCAVYMGRMDVTEPEKRLYRLRTGQIFGGPLNDILEDIFIAHPELASWGLQEQFDWSRARKNRDEQIKANKIMRNEHPDSN